MSLVVALVLAAWPVPRDAGPEAYADPANWPNEPEWAGAWVLHSFSDGGARVDRAWSVTRGAPEVVLGVVAPAVDVSDPLVARAWRLNAAEFPDAGDVNGNGRLDVGDLGAVPDVNGNAAVDLEDVLAAFSDGVDQEGNGRIDDLCGWDLGNDRSVRSTTDAGIAPWRALAAPVDDGLPGIGACPDCTLVPFIATAATLADTVVLAGDAGVRVLLLPHVEDELSAALDLALRSSPAMLITPGSGGLASFPLALHPSVHSPRAGCRGPVLSGSALLPTAACSEEAAWLYAGAAGLVFSVAPDAGPVSIAGLLGGPRADVGRAVTLAEPGLPAAVQPVSRLAPSPRSPVSAAERCEVAGAGVPCDGGVPLAARATSTLDLEPSLGFVWFVERAGPYEWWTALAAPPDGTQFGQFPPVAPFGPGSGPPRYVDLVGQGSETVVAATVEGLRGFSVLVEQLGPALPSGRLPPAVGDIDGDGVLDVAVLGDDGTLAAHDFNGRLLPGFPRQLSAAPAGPPVLAPTLGGTALVTVDVAGRVTHATPAFTWTYELQSAQRSSPAAGFIDADNIADLAFANAETLRVLLNDDLGPTASSWSSPTRAPQVLLGNLVGDARLEVVVDRVFDASGEVLLELPGWTPSVVPPALARLGTTAHRSLIQVEAAGDAWELTRYDVESGLRSGADFVERRVLRLIRHRPARGGFVVADMTTDEAPDVLLPTEDGLLFIIDGEGQMPAESPLPALGTVLSSPALGVAQNRLELAVRTTRGDLIRWLVPGETNDISWESAGHDRQNSNNAETKLPERRIRGLGITEPPVFPPPPCSCASVPALAALALLLLARRHSSRSPRAAQRASRARR